MLNKYDGTCCDCGCLVTKFQGILESTSGFARGRRKTKFKLWCQTCYDKSDNSSVEDRCCGDRAYEDACERACNF